MGLIAVQCFSVLIRAIGINLKFDEMGVFDEMSGLEVIKVLFQARHGLSNNNCHLKAATS